MPASRCSLCGISYPRSHSKCKVCESKLDGINDKHDADWEEKVELALAPATPSLEEQRKRRWFFRQYRRMGFSREQCRAFYDRDEGPVDWRDLERTLAKGATHDQAIACWL